MAEILMKGVELPKGGDVIELTIDSDGCIIFYDGHGKIEQYVEVIQPHGELIERDKILEYIENHEELNVGTLYDVIQDAPTILEETT